MDARNSLKRNKIIGAGALVSSVVLFSFKEAIGSVIGSFATKILNPRLLRDGGMLSLSLTDVAILLLFLVGFIALFWPWLSKKMLSELDRRTMVTETSGRVTVSSYNFTTAAEIEALPRQSNVFVDCFFSLDELLLVDEDLADFYSIKARKIVVVEDDDIESLEREVPSLILPIMLYCRLEPKFLFLTRSRISGYGAESKSITVQQWRDFAKT